VGSTPPGSAPPASSGCREHCVVVSLSPHTHTSLSGSQTGYIVHTCDSLSYFVLVASCSWFGHSFRTELGIRSHLLAVPFAGQLTPAQLGPSVLSAAFPRCNYTRWPTRGRSRPRHASAPRVRYTARTGNLPPLAASSRAQEPRISRMRALVISSHFRQG
jgi:hypothetical protein